MYNEQALIAYVRKKYASDLLKERSIFRNFNDFDKDFLKVKNFNFITSDLIIYYSSINEINFHTVNEEYEKSIKLLKPRQTSIKVDFNITEYGEKCGCFECYGNCNNAVKVTVSNHQIKFKALKSIKLDFKSTLNFILRDAKWKINNQVNSKDTKRYLAIINKYKK